MHAQYVPVLTDIAPLLLIRELPQDEYPTPALPRPFTSHDVEPVMFGPNISGTLYLDDLDSPRKPTLSGAFYDTGKRTTDPAGNYEGGCVAGLSATRSSSVYGKSQTVQPASLRLIPCIKV